MKPFLLYAFHVGCIPGYKLKLHDSFRLVLDESDLENEGAIFKAIWGKHMHDPTLCASVLTDYDLNRPAQKLLEVKHFCKIYE
jgi:hypothetical protein